MTLFDYLLTPSGLELVHAIILVLVAVSGYISYLSHQQAKRNERLLDDHIAKTSALGPKDREPTP